MRRREFISLLGGVAAVWPLMAHAQQTMPVIGFLGSSSPDLYAPAMRTFRQGLSEAGYVEGRNVAIEFRWANGQNDLLPALAADLVRRQVGVIVAPGSTPAALAAKAATETIPIVFQVGADPVAAGLVMSLARPGGDVTGVTNINTELVSKRLELLRELVPKATIAGLLVNPTSPEITKAVSTDLQSTARTLGLQLHILQASTERDFDTVFATLAQLRVGALVIAPDAFFISRSEQTRRIDGPPWDACDHPISRICRGWRPYELRRQLYGAGPSSLASTPVGFSKARSPPICRYSRR